VQPTAEPPDPVEGASNERGDYRCRLVTKSPANWAVLPARSLWKVSWTLINTGPKTWDNSVVIAWIEGNKIGVEKQYNFIKDVKPGQDVKAIISVLTPAKPGNYRSVWGLRSLKTNNIFCMFTVKITIE
jgi:hypothetical protein